MTDHDSDQDYVPREEYQEQKALVEALQRKVSRMESSIETLENRLDHREGESSKWQGAKADVIDELDVGERVTHQDLVDIQSHIGEAQAKRNVKALLRSDWFEREDRGSSLWKFTGKPDE